MSESVVLATGRALPGGHGDARSPTAALRSRRAGAADRLAGAITAEAGRR